MSPFMEAGFLKMLATVSDSVSVRVAASEVHGLTDEDIRQLCRAHGKLVLRRARHLHAKLVVLDSELLITGSANITLGSLDRPIEVLQATSDAGVVERGIDEFRRLWGAI